MANLDTRTRRASSVGNMLPFVLAPPLPDGTLSSSDRRHIPWSYGGSLLTQGWWLEVDWNNDGDYDDTGENITAYVRGGIRTYRGRDSNSQLTGRSNAGNLSCDLLNTDGRFSSFNTSSPLTGNIKPSRSVRLRYAYDGALHPIWQGFLDELVPSADRDSLPIASLRASGPLAWINDTRRQVSVAMATNVATGTEIGVVLTAAGWSTTARTLDAGQTTMTRFWFGKQSALSGIRKIEDTEGGFLREGPNGYIIFEDREHRLVTPHTVSQASYSDASAASLSYEAIQQADPWSDVYNLFEAPIQLYSVGALADLWTLAASGASSPSIPAGESRTFWANFPTLDQSAQALAVDAWTTPVATTDYTANSQADGLGSNLTASVSVAVSKFANSMKITLTNGHATSTAYITLLKARGTPVNALDVFTMKAEDETSQDDFGIRTFPHPGEFVPTAQEGQDWADFNLAIYKDPIPRLAVTLNAQRNAATLLECLTRDVSDRVSVIATGTRTKLGIAEDFFVEAVSHRIDAGGTLVTTYLLSPATSYAGFWVLGTSLLGESTKLAY